MSHLDVTFNFFDLKIYLYLEYGGDAGTLQTLIEEQEKLLMKYRDYFLEDEKLGVDETKRVGKKQNSDSLFGLEGSFRKLDID